MSFDFRHSFVLVCFMASGASDSVSVSAAGSCKHMWIDYIFWQWEIGSPAADDSILLVGTEEIIRYQILKIWSPGKIHRLQVSIDWIIHNLGQHLILHVVAHYWFYAVFVELLSRL
jgi:hypothetical protein